MWGFKKKRGEEDIKKHVRVKLSAMHDRCNEMIGLVEKYNVEIPIQLLKYLKSDIANLHKNLK